MSRVRERLNKIHNTLKPTIHLMTILVGFLFSIYLIGGIGTILPDTMWNGMVLIVMSLIVIYWVAYFSTRVLLGIIKRQIKK